MNHTKSTSNNMKPLTLDTQGLCQALNCGRETALKIGLEANARIQIGRRVLWNINKIQVYLDEISE